MQYSAVLIKIMDAELCSDEGMSDYAYTLAYEAFSNNPEIMEILEDVEATDGRFYFPERHPGIEFLIEQRQSK